MPVISMFMLVNQKHKKIAKFHTFQPHKRIIFFMKNCPSEMTCIKFYFIVFFVHKSNNHISQSSLAVKKKNISKRLYSHIYC